MRKPSSVSWQVNVVLLATSEPLSRKVIQDHIHGIGNYFCQAN